MRRIDNNIIYKYGILKWKLKKKKFLKTLKYYATQKKIRLSNSKRKVALYRNVNNI